MGGQKLNTKTSTKPPQVPYKSNIWQRLGKILSTKVDFYTSEIRNMWNSFQKKFIPRLDFTPSVFTDKWKNLLTAPRQLNSCFRKRYDRHNSAGQRTSVNTPVRSTGRSDIESSALTPMTDIYIKENRRKPSVYAGFRRFEIQNSIIPTRCRSFYLKQFCLGDVAPAVLIILIAHIIIAVR